MLTPELVFNERNKYYQAFLVAERQENEKLAIELKTIVSSIDWFCGKKETPLLKDVGIKTND